MGVEEEGANRIGSNQPQPIQGGGLGAVGSSRGSGPIIHKLAIFGVGLAITLLNPIVIYQSMSGMGGKNLQG